MAIEISAYEEGLVKKVFNKQQLTKKEYMDFRELWPTVIVETSDKIGDKIYDIDKHLVGEYCRIENGIQIQKTNPKYVKYSEVKQNRESILELLIEGKVKGYTGSIEKLSAIKDEVRRDRKLTAYQYDRLTHSVKKLLGDEEIKNLRSTAKNYVENILQDLNVYLRDQHKELESRYQTRIQAQAQEKAKAEIIKIKPAQKSSLFGSLFSRMKKAVAVFSF